jgi:hypothetical protein
MKIEEQLWRTFQSDFAKLLNSLPKNERKQYYQVFSLKNELKGSFNFNNIENLLQKRVQDKKHEKKRTKLLRRLIGIHEEGKQKAILKQASRDFAKGLYANRLLVVNKNPDVIKKTKIGLESISQGCRFYPCGKENMN